MSAATGRQWVDCPICNMPDVRSEPDGDEGGRTIYCTNTACRSNGGDYDAFRPETLPPQSANERAETIDTERLTEIARERHGASGLCCQLRLQALAELDALKSACALALGERSWAMIEDAIDAARGSTNPSANHAGAVSGSFARSARGWRGGETIIAFTQRFERELMCEAIRQYGEVIPNDDAALARMAIDILRPKARVGSTNPKRGGHST